MTNQKLGTETRRKAAEKIMNRLAYWIGPQKVVDFEHAVDLAEQYADQFKSSREPYFKHLEELQYPHREICHLCHRVVAVGFWVPNEIWKAVVHHSHLNAIHCLNCFIERADEKLIDWSKDIQFYAVSLRSHLDDIHNGKDDMILFHTPPKSEQPQERHP